MYRWWGCNFWRSKGRRICGRGEGANPWVGRRLLRNGELLLLQRAAANGDTPRVNSRDTLIGGLRARRSTTRHFTRYGRMFQGQAEEKKGGERIPNVELHSPRAFPDNRRAQIQFGARHHAHLKTSHWYHTGVSNTSNSTNDSETSPSFFVAQSVEIVSRSYAILRIATRYHDQ
jgi:hypothetical protein